MKMLGVRDGMGDRRNSGGRLIGFEANRRNDERMRFEPPINSEEQRFGRHIAGISSLPAIDKQRGTTSKLERVNLTYQKTPQGENRSVSPLR